MKCGWRQFEPPLEFDGPASIANWASKSKALQDILSKSTRNCLPSAATLAWIRCPCEFKTLAVPAGVFVARSLLVTRHLHKSKALQAGNLPCCYVGLSRGGISLASPPTLYCSCRRVFLTTACGILKLIRQYASTPRLDTVQSLGSY